MKKLFLAILFLSSIVLAQRTPKDDFGWLYSSGSNRHFSTVNKFGWNGDVDAAIEDVWDGGGTYSFLDSAVVLYIESDSTTDTIGGTGAITIQIQGLDSLWALQLETVTITGTADVVTTNKWIRVFRMKVLTAGSNATNNGVIQLYDSLGTRVIAQIGASNAQTLMAIYTIPAGYTGYMTSYYSSILKANTSGAVDYSLWMRPDADDGNTPFNLKHRISSQAAGSSYFQHEFFPYYKIAEKTDIRISAFGSTTNFEVGSGFDIILVQN